jgi:hypothetical protein
MGRCMGGLGCEFGRRFIFAVSRLSNHVYIALVVTSK